MNSPAIAPQGPRLDEFGMDRDYIESWGKTLFNFLCRYYWRIETRGLENVPLQGRAILVGTHRGFMPWDAIMTLHLIVRNRGRVPRFLCHPGLLKFPVIANFITRMGGVLACRENAERILAADELLGILPEGVEGAFSLYRDAYKLASFGRDDFVKMALRHHAPIVPFVIVGNAEDPAHVCPDKISLVDKASRLALSANLHFPDRALSLAFKMAHPVPGPHQRPRGLLP